MRITRWAVLGLLALGMGGLSYRLCACIDPPVDTSETRSDSPSDPPTPPEPQPFIHHNYTLQSLVLRWQA